MLRSIAEPWALGSVRNTGLLISAVLLLAAAAAFAAIVIRTLVHPDSKAEATGYYFVLGAIGYCVGAAINFAQTVEMVRDGLEVAPLAKETPQIFVQQYGFLLTFASGVGARAIPTLTGRRDAATPPA